MDINQLTDVVLIILGLLLLWAILRIFLRLTAKIFSCGCAIILILGILVVLVRLFNP